MNRPDLNLFSHAVVMTLDKRLKANDLGNAAASFREAGLPVQEFLVGDGQLFPAGNYDWIDQDASPRRQAFNYASAFRQIINQARIPRWCNAFLYLEDDAELVPGAFEQLPVSLQELISLVGDQWHLLFLGSNCLNGPVEVVSPSLIKPSYVLDLHAVAINWRALPLLASVEPSSHRTIDGVIADMIKDGRLTTYACNPSIIYQKVGWSHNENRMDDKRDRQLVRYTR